MAATTEDNYQLLLKQAQALVEAKTIGLQIRQIFRLYYLIHLIMLTLLVYIVMITKN